MSRVVLTGGSGFIGQYVRAELESRGHEVAVADRRVGVSVLGEEFLDFCAGSEAVVHLAGILGTAELFDRAEEAVDVNVKGAIRVLEACREHGAAFVGITLHQKWHNVYSATKGCAKNLASAWHEFHGVPVSHVLAYNAYGAGQHVHGVQKILPTFADRAWRGVPIPIWGNGEQTVDLVHAKDVARMLCDAMAFGDDVLFEAGNGEEFTVNEVARMVLEVTGSDSPIEYLPMRPGEIPNTRIHAKGSGWDLLDWRPRFNKDDFAEAVRWYKEPRP